MIKDGPIQAYASAKVREYMTGMLGGDERLCKLLIPTFPVGTRRVTSAPGYLEALRKDNVDVVGGGIKRFLPEGIEMETGEILKVDAVICATGFDLSFCPRFPLVGREGNLQDIWKDGTPEAYMSVAVSGIPNYFSESLGHTFSRAAAPTDVSISFPGPQRPHRPRLRLHTQRAYRQVHCPRAQEGTDRAHPHHRAKSRGRERLQ